MALFLEMVETNQLLLFVVPKVTNMWIKDSLQGCDRKRQFVQSKIWLASKNWMFDEISNNSCMFVKHCVCVNSECSLFLLELVIGKVIYSLLSTSGTKQAFPFHMIPQYLAVEVLLQNLHFSVAVIVRHNCLFYIILH